jgi:hypothetical protein
MACYNGSMLRYGSIIWYKMSRKLIVSVKRYR